MGASIAGGRILVLAADPDRLDAQLAGADLSLAEAGPLRDDVSTDEITPLTVMTVFDARLGRYPYVGLKAGDRLPIGVDAVRRGGFTVVVAGRRYGKGSSREHSPLAELRAGVRLVIAESFERIYRQNADNIGLFTSTDPGLVERIRAGEAITVDELVAGRDALAADILRAGGLLAFGQGRAGARGTARVHAGDASGDAPGDASGDAGRGAAVDAAVDAAGPRPTAADAGRPLTLFEKIVARHTADGRVPAPGEGGFVRADRRFIHEYYTGLCAGLLDEAFGERLALHDPASIVCFEDHLSLAHRSPAHVGGGLMQGVGELSRAHRGFVARHGLRDHGWLPDSEGSEGISHAMMAERYACPGELIAGTDSHTPHSGALGCVAFGVGTTDIANAFVTGEVRFTMPEVLRVDLAGERPAGVTAKDVVLHLLALPRIRAGAGVGRVFEFGGPGSSERRDQVTVSAINRNFPGRSGPGQVWLASPPTVAASAIAGRIVSFDELRRGATATA